MFLRVNGEDRFIDDGTTALALVNEMLSSDEGVAVARNGEVVPKSTWARVVLEDGDHIEVLEAARGG